MKLETFEQIQEFAKVKLAVKNNLELYKKLEITKQTAHNWSKNDKGALKLKATIINRFGDNFFSAIDAGTVFETIFDKTPEALIMFSRFFKNFQNKFVDMLADEIYKEEEEIWLFEAAPIEKITVPKSSDENEIEFVQVDNKSSEPSVSESFSQIISILNEIKKLQKLQNETAESKESILQQIKYLKLEYEDLKSKKKEEIVERYQLERFARVLNIEVNTFIDKKDEEIYNYIMCGSNNK